MVRRIQITVWLCLAFFISVCQIPSLSFKNIDYRNGLPLNEYTEDMIEDHLGRIWIGYRKGLYYYDGINVRLFTARMDDSTAITENWILSLYMDHTHKIWIGTRNTGINIYHPDNS